MKFLIDHMVFFNNDNVDSIEKEQTIAGILCMHGTFTSCSKTFPVHFAVHDTFYVFKLLISLSSVYFADSLLLYHIIKEPTLLIVIVVKMCECT